MPTKTAYRTYHAEIPEGAHAVWGARLIAPNDLVWDRQDLQADDDDAKHDLIAWLNGEPEGSGAIAKMRDYLAANYSKYGSQDTLSPFNDILHVLYEDETGIIVGSPQASCGYVYVSGWLK
jgi:hypothetical protein